jgi:putative membrane protein
MPRFLLRLVVTALAVLLASNLFKDRIVVRSPEGAFVFAFVLGLLNAFLRPVLLLFTLPLTLLTLGLFTFVVNAIVFWMATIVFRDSIGVQVSGFEGAFLGALVVSAASFVASRALK